MAGEVTIRCENVSKKFSRNLRKSLWYGLKDTFAELRCSAEVEKEPKLRDSEFWALRDVSFEMRRGDSMALMGSNGSGKTTLLKTLNGLLKPDTGRIEMHGRIGALIALGSGFNPVLSGRENIYINGSVLGFSRADIAARFDEIVEFAGLEHAIDAPVRTYSSGMQVRLGFSIATCVEPDILLIDEVLAVGDFNFRARCYGRLAKMMSDTTILFVSHSAQQVTRVCRTGLLLEKGNPVILDTIANVILEYNRRNAPNTEFRVVYDGDLKLEEAKLAATAIKFNSPLAVKLGITSQKRYENCFVRILLRKADEELIGEWNSELHGQVFCIPEGDSTHEFTIPNVRFHDGIYRVSLFVMSEDRVTHLINAANVGTFESSGHCYGGVAVQF